MSILSAKDICKEYGTDVIIKGVSFHINEGDKVGVVGPNGAGKTTLLRVLTGELTADEGDFYIPQGVKMGYLSQKSEFDSERTVIDEVENIFLPMREMEKRMEEIHDAIPNASGAELEKLIHEQDELHEQYKDQGGYTYRSEMKGILSSMAFLENQYDQQISSLSGGEKTRLALALLLLEKPDLLILDEPTNHLDIGTLRWLEQYLKDYRGSLIVVSHDRYFLDELCNKIFEIENHALRVFDGNYTYYAQRKKELREEEMRRFKAYKTEKARQEDLVRRYKERGTEKLAKRAHSREMKLAKMEEVSAPAAQRGKMKIHFKEKYKSGNDVLFMEDVSKTFGIGKSEKKLFEHAELDVKRGERICMVGSNGVGKTTLMKIIQGDIRPNTGKIKMGFNVKINYYDQEQKLLNEDNTVLEEIRGDFGDYNDTELRTILGSFLFRGEDVFLPVRALSGGEKARLSLLKMMMGGGNLLLLDEPTNHLDIESREVFEDALLEFPGTAIIVSHDRYFLNKVPTKIVELEKDGIHTFLGKYDYYFEKKKEIESGKKYLEELKDQGGMPQPASQSTPEEPKLTSQQERALKKEQEAAERRAKREKEALEIEIAKLEAEIADKEALMCQPEVLQDLKRLGTLDEEVKQAKERLDEVYEKWLQYE